MKILITGANGLLGSNLCSIYSKNNEVIATSNTKPTFSNCFNYKLDITKPEELILIEKIKPYLIIHCAALVNVDYCEEHPEEAELVNTIGTKNIALAAKKSGSYLIHISTDAIFDGQKGDYSEIDKPNPINIYARTKLEAEKEVQSIGDNYALVRTNIYGWNRKKNQKSLAEWMLDKLESREKMPAFKDVLYSPILVNNLAEAILELYGMRFNGIINIAGSESCSKLAFAYRLSEVFGLDKKLILPASVDELKLKAKRSKNMSLNVEKAQKLLKTKLLSVKDGLKTFKELKEKGYLEELNGGRDE